MIERVAVLVALTTVLIAGCDARSRPLRSVFSDGNCTYGDAVYSHGATACQSGTQYRCEEGQWKGWGTVCAENPLAAEKGCELNGNGYSPGSASCQAGTQYRCDDGAWRTLALACAGDSVAPAPVAADGRTCTYNDATVATRSTICKSGVTFRCDDGEWRNLGTTCR